MTMKPPRWTKPGVAWESATTQERADALQAAYLPISAHGGELLYILARAKRPATIVEFGTSYGTSRLYLAAAVADNGMGSVVSTELNGAKVGRRSRQSGRSPPFRSGYDSTR
jgi:predicted O-methyltransferase YrrM